MDDGGHKMYVMKGYTQLGQVVTMNVAKPKAKEWNIIRKTSWAM